MTRWPEILELERAGLDVFEFTVYHYRIEKRFDIFPNGRGRPWQWRDGVSGKHGVKPPEQFAQFIPNFILANPKPIPVSAPSKELGWWTCMGCGKKMRDDGSSEAARRMFKHLEEECDATHTGSE